MTDPAPASRSGPRTPEGKARSARNALRHGLRSSSFVLLPHEDPEAFTALVAELRRVHAPADAIEALYVDAIAIAIWRELRVDRMEAEAMADIPPAEAGRSCGTDLTSAGNRASLATLARYRQLVQQEHRRALEMLRRHRALTAEAKITNEPVAAEALPRLVAAAPPPPVAAEPLAPAQTGLREAERVRLDPMDTPLLRAMGRDPDLVLPVPGLEPRFWPKAQDRALTGPFPAGGPQPYRRVPGLPWHLWWEQQALAPPAAGAQAPARAA